MHYVDNHKHTKISLAIACICAILSPHGFAQTVQPKEIKTAIYQTGSETQKANSSSGTIQETKKDRKDCNAECKVETLIKLGITSKLSNLIVSECKEGAIDPRHCIIVASAIIINESGGGKSNACKTRFNCFGIGSGKVVYTNYQEAVANWISKYNRYWFKAKDMTFFYANSGDIPPSRYCMSEDSSGSNLGCPHGLRITTSIFKKLNTLF